MATLQEIQSKLGGVLDPSDPTAGAQGSVYNDPSKQYSIIDGKLYNYGGATIDPSISAAFPAATPEEMRFALDPSIQQSKTQLSDFAPALAVLGPAAAGAGLFGEVAGAAAGGASEAGVGGLLSSAGTGLEAAEVAGAPGLAPSGLTSAATGLEAAEAGTGGAPSVAEGVVPGAPTFAADAGVPGVAEGTVTTTLVPGETLAPGALDSLTAQIPGEFGGVETGGGFSPTGLPSGSGGTGTDYSIYTGGAPTDVPNPVGDETITPADDPAKTGLMQKVLDKIGGINPLTAGALGLNAAAALNQSRNAKSIPGQLEALGKPAQDAANTLLGQYASGQINPSDKFAIDKWKQQQTAAAKNYYAKAGISDSSTAKNAVAQIEAQAVAMEDLARKGLLDTGLKALGVASGPITAGIQATAQADQALTTASGSALQSLLLLDAYSSRSRNPAPVVP